MWKKNTICAISELFERFERRVVNYEFWLKSDTTVKEILATMSKRA